MNRSLFAPLAFLCAAAAAFVPLSSPAAEEADDRIVVLISVDGLAHFYFDDPKAEMPTIRQLAAEGARAKMMKCSMPTVTWPNHTTLVTGVHPAKHGVIGNTFFDRSKGQVVPFIPDPLFDKEEIVKSPTIYDVAKQAGLKTAAIIWPATRRAKTLDWTVADVFPNELFQGTMTPSLLEEFKAVGIPFEKQEEWCKTGKGEDRDRMYVQMLNHVIRKHRPNVGLLHLVEVDHIEHAKGPQSPEAYAAVKFADDRVREVWDELKKSFPNKATLIVSSDHGFFPYQQQIQPNVALRNAGLLTAEGTKISGGVARAVGQGGGTFIYVLDQSKRDELIPQLAKLFRETEGVELVITPDQYPKYGLADPTKDKNMADLVLSAKSGYSFGDSLAGGLVVTPKTEQVRGSHGYDPNQPALHGTLVTWGAGIKAGTTIERAENIDVAPTMATLLGLKMEGADGRSLNELLAK